MTEELKAIQEARALIVQAQITNVKPRCVEDKLLNVWSYLRDRENEIAEVLYGDILHGEA